eukprot:evm.model.scf_184.1 EVM.evm.TU.scf_184.1   scf_184:2856-3749(+)
MPGVTGPTLGPRQANRTSQMPLAERRCWGGNGRLRSTFALSTVLAALHLCYFFTLTGNFRSMAQLTSFSTLRSSLGGASHSMAQFSPERMPELLKGHGYQSMFDRRTMTMDEPETWERYNHSGMAGEVQSDPVSCRPPVWQSAAGYLGAGGAHKSTLAFALTRMDNRYTAVLIKSAVRLGRVSSRVISVLVLESGTNEEAVALRRTGLATVQGTSIFLVGNPVDMDLLPRAYKRAVMNNDCGISVVNNCCGVSEFVKLQAIALPYEQVMLLDLDVRIYKPVDHLFQCDADLLYLSGP